MFREMRRKRQLLEEKEVEKIHQLKQFFLIQHMFYLFVVELLLD